MYLVTLVSREGDGTTEVVEALGVEAQAIGSKGDIEVAVFPFDEREDAKEFRDDVVNDLIGLGVFFKVRLSESDDDPEEVMLDVLSLES